MNDGKKAFLAVDDFGSGGIWFVVLARSEQAISNALSSVTVCPEGQPGLRIVSEPADTRKMR